MWGYSPRDLNGHFEKMIAAFMQRLTEDADSFTVEPAGPIEVAPPAEAKPK
jgi:hypothetical protein